MKSSEQLIERLREAGQDLPPCTVLERIGRNTKGRLGRWSWFAYCPLAGTDPEHHWHSNLHVGSHWSMAELLAAPGLTFQRLDSSGDICVDPDPLPGRQLPGDQNIHTEQETIMNESSEETYRKVTIHVPVEMWGTDTDGDVSKLREIAGAVNEVVTEYITSTIAVDVAATGEATVTEGWVASPDDTFTIYAEDGEYSERAPDIERALARFRARRPDCFVSAIVNDGMRPGLIVAESL